MIGPTHIHLYREGFADKWAFVVDSSEFTNLSNIYSTFKDFCTYCNIRDLPPIQGGFL